MIEVYKSIHKRNPEFMWDIFHIKNISYLLRKNTNLILPQTITKTSGITSQIMLKPRQICRSLNTKLMQYKINIAAAKYANNIQICHPPPPPPPPSPF